MGINATMNVDIFGIDGYTFSTIIRCSDQDSGVVDSDTTLYNELTANGTEFEEIEITRVDQDEFDVTVFGADYQPIGDGVVIFS